MTTVSNPRWRSDRGRVKKDSTNKIIDDRLPRGPRGYVLCRYCQKETSNEYRTFCNAICIHNFKLQTQPGYVRLKLFERDKGICQECGINAHGIFEGAANCSDLEMRLRYFTGLGEKWKLKVKKPLSDFAQHFTPGMFWEAAHIVSVHKGGGACCLENYRTLCVPCHYLETNQEKAERATLRKMEMQNTSKDQTRLHKYWILQKKPSAPSSSEQINKSKEPDTRPHSKERTPSIVSQKVDDTRDIKSTSTFRGVVHQIISTEQSTNRELDNQFPNASRSTITSGKPNSTVEPERKKHWSEIVRTMLAKAEEEKGLNTDWDKIKLRYPDIFSPQRSNPSSNFNDSSEKPYVEIDLTLESEEPAITNNTSQNSESYLTTKPIPRPKVCSTEHPAIAPPQKAATTTRSNLVASTSASTKRKPFSAEEEQVLIDCVKKFGTNWTYIKSQHPTLFAARTPMNLKDKARNLKKKGILDY